MTTHDPLTEAYAELSGLLLTEENVETTLRRIAELAAALVPHCDLAAVTVEQDGRYVTAVSTDQLAREIDEAQYRAGDGPCLDAIRHNRVNRVDDCTAETRWPEFASSAVEKGITSFLALPLLVRDAPIGALNLYSNQALGFTELDEQICALFTGAAAAVLANAQVYRGAVRLVEQLQDALESRATIEQAKGMLMEREGCGADEAFRLLAEASQRTNRTLRDIADALVSRIDGVEDKG
jgi:GAF domain-containing protein